jgi:glycosyltransferase involved in cell wall biosynthesis
VNPDHILATGTPNPCDPPAPGWCLGEDATPGDIAKAIQVLLTDDQLWSASSAAARDLALQRFDLAAVGDQYDKLLCHLLEKRTTSR